jgi:NAD-specific glutamate dehydrogenase
MIHNRCHRLNPVFYVRQITYWPRVAAGGHRLPTASFIARAAAKVDDDNAQVLAEPIEAVGKRGRGGLVDEPGRFEARDAASVLGRAALVVIEVGRHGDDRLLEPRNASASRLIFCSSRAESSSGENSFPPRRTLSR